MSSDKSRLTIYFHTDTSAAWRFDLGITDSLQPAMLRFAMLAELRGVTGSVDRMFCGMTRPLPISRFDPDWAAAYPLGSHEGAEWEPAAILQKFQAAIRTAASMADWNNAEIWAYGADFHRRVIERAAYEAMCPFEWCGLEPQCLMRRATRTMGFPKKNGTGNRTPKLTEAAERALGLPMDLPSQALERGLVTIQAIAAIHRHCEAVENSNTEGMSSHG